MPTTFGIGVTSWAVDDTAAMQALIDAGVDGMSTDPGSGRKLLTVAAVISAGATVSGEDTPGKYRAGVPHVFRQVRYSPGPPAAVDGDEGGLGLARIPGGLTGTETDRIPEMSRELPTWSP